MKITLFPCYAYHTKRAKGKLKTEEVIILGENKTDEYVVRKLHNDKTYSVKRWGVMQKEKFDRETNRLLYLSTLRID